MKTMFIFLIAAGTWGYAAAQTGTTSTRSSTAGTGSNTDTSLTSFVRKAMKMNAMEIEAGRIASQRAKSTAVKAFANRMVTDHTSAAEQLRRIVSSKNLPGLMMNQGNPTGMSGVSGSAANANNQGINASGNRTTVPTGVSGQPTISSGNAGNTNVGDTSRTGRAGRTDAGVTGNNNRRNNTGVTGNNNRRSNTGDSTTVTGNRNTGITGRDNASGTSVNNSQSGNANMSGYGQQGMMDTTSRAKMTRLMQKTGAEFDREYMNMMVQDHMEAISLFEGASNVADTDIKLFVARMLPTLRDHLTSAKTVQSSLGTGGGKP